MAPATSISGAALKIAPTPAAGAPLEDIVHALVPEVLPVQVQHLLYIGQISSGAQVTFVAQMHPNKPSHYARLIISGPGFRGQRLLSLTNKGVAAAVITLPTLTVGQWQVGIEDASGITRTATKLLTGHILLALGQFTVT